MLNKTDLLYCPANKPGLFQFFFKISMYYWGWHHLLCQKVHILGVSLHKPDDLIWIFFKIFPKNLSLFSRSAYSQGRFIWLYFSWNIGLFAGSGYSQAWLTYNGYGGNINKFVSIKKHHLKKNSIGKLKSAIYWWKKQSFQI